MFFIGDATLKTDLPPNVLTNGLRTYIKNKAAVILEPETVAHCQVALTELDRTTDRKAAAKQHEANLKARTGKTYGWKPTLHSG